MINQTGALPLLLTPALATLFFPVVLLGILANEVIRIIVSHFLFLIYHDRIQLVEDGLDGFWSYKKKGSSRNVLLYMTVPTDTLNHQMITNFYRNEIQTYKNEEGERLYKKFEKVMTSKLGYACWKACDNFNIRNHIRVLTKEKIYTAQDFQKYLSEFGEDMSEDKPQWEIILFPKYKDEEGKIRSILVLRFLHCYMDGLSSIMLFKERITPTMDYTIDPLKFKIPTWKKILFHLNFLVYGPFFSCVFIVEKFLHLPWIKRSEKSIERKKFYGWTKQRLVKEETVRRIRMHAGKATVTNVLSTAFARALRKVLPENRLLAEVSISELVAYLPYPDPKPQNRYATFTYPVSTKNENFLKKIESCKRKSKKSMLGPEILASYYSFKQAGRFPTFYMPIWLYGSYCSLLFSNAPFTKGNVILKNGTQVLQLGGFTPQPNDMGLSITTTCYGGIIKICGCADSTWLSQEELDQILEEMPIQIEEMASQCPLIPKSLSSKNEKSLDAVDCSNNINDIQSNAQNKNSNLDEESESDVSEKDTTSVMDLRTR